MSGPSRELLLRRDKVKSARIAELEGENERLRRVIGAAVEDSANLEAENANFESGARCDRDEIEGLKAERDAPLLTRIAELKAENERLKVCGNCAYENQWFGSCDDDVDEALPDSGVVAPPDSCHFTPSRWTERGTK